MPQHAKKMNRKLPRKAKQWDKDILEALNTSLALMKEQYFGIFVAEDDSSALARNRDALTALGCMHAFMHRDIIDTQKMLDIRLEVYRKIFDELRENLINHPSEMFVSAYLYTHVCLNTLSPKKYNDIAAAFSQHYAEQLGWNNEDDESL